MRDCGVTWFIYVEIKVAPGAPDVLLLSVPPAQPYPQQVQEKSQCLECLFHIKVQSFVARRQQLSSLSPHQGSLVCPQLLQWCSPLEVCIICVRASSC